MPLVYLQEMGVKEVPTPREGKGGNPLVDEAPFATEVTIYQAKTACIHSGQGECGFLRLIQELFEGGRLLLISR